MTSSPLVAESLSQVTRSSSKLFGFSFSSAGLLLLCFTGILELTWPQQIVLGILTIALVIWMDRSSSSYLITLTLHAASPCSRPSATATGDRDDAQVLPRPRHHLERSRRVLHLRCCSSPRPMPSSSCSSATCRRSGRCAARPCRCPTIPTCGPPSIC